MANAAIQRISSDLDTDGAALASFDELGAEFDDRAIDQLLDLLTLTEKEREAAGEARTGMLMFRESAPLDLGRRIIEPIVRRLVDTSVELSLYAVNQYQAGEFFTPHQDYFDGTVFIITVTGVREFRVYCKEPEDDVFTTVARTYVLRAGSIMLLNGYHNLGHAVTCLKGPSVSIVGDVPQPIG